MERLPVLPLGQLVVYPHVVLPLALTDPKAVQLIDEIIQGEKRLLLGVVKSMSGMEPPEGAVMNTLPHQLYDVGTLGTIVRMLKLGDGSVRVMVQGLERARLKDVAQGEKWLMAGCESLIENLRSEEHTSELQSRSDLVCRLLLEKKKKNKHSRPLSAFREYRLAVLSSTR